jgi:predicted nuclease of predicted toxin-antitoxin system
MRWSFLVDENQSPSLAQRLQSHGVDAEHVNDVLGPGAGDLSQVLPYAQQNNCIIITNDVDFRELSPSRHEGVLFVKGQNYEAHELASAVLDVIEAYPSRDQFYLDFIENYL